MKAIAFGLVAVFLSGCIEAPQDRRAREELPERVKDLERQLECIQIPKLCPKETR